jgi:hypothetical protein
MKAFMRRWGAVVILIILFLGSWTGQLITQATEAAVQAQTHGQPFQMGEFWPEFWAATFENWQSEFLQLAVQCFLIASFMQRYMFRADYSADKEDVDRILRAIRESKQ